MPRVDGAFAARVRGCGAAAWRTGQQAGRRAGVALRAVRCAASRGAAALRTQRAPLEGLHLAGLWAVAIAQPIFDLLGRSPEFFVAHDTRPGDLLGLVLVLCLAAPACCVLVTRAGRRLGARPHALAAGAVVGTLAAALALATIRQEAHWDRDASFGVAAVCGALAGGGYVWFTTVRLFATFLSPAALVVPAAFLMQPAIAPLLSAPGAGAIDGVTFDETPPVVVAVFDQLPLVSLLDRDGAIDRTLYPSFAALADDATWFRNASAVSGWTEGALPAIVTGNYPASGLLPTANDHPANLFTLLGSRYDLHVLEPLTDLCPETLCEPDRPGVVAWFTAVLSDLAVVYLQAVLPNDLTASLPPVTQSWRDFAADDTFIGRWRARRVRDRGAEAADFIAAIPANAGGVRSPLHFMHLLLPHEPWLYLPTGQRYTARQNIVGGAADRWSDDAWAVAINYQRHLLQVQYVDSVLGALLERLRAVGIYDDALIVATSDHGVSLRPGRRFRLPTEETFADIASVPLLIKQPGQREGRVVATNVETIDILPTLAAGLGVRLPWDTDGSNAFAEGETHGLAKTMLVAGQRVLGPGDLGDAIAEGVARKFAIFENGDPTKPRLGVHDEIVGAPVADLQSEQSADFDVTIDSASLLSDVDHDSFFVPAHLTGGIVARAGGSPIPPLAIAVNGVVAAVTRTYPFSAFGHAVPWEAVVDPRLLDQGANVVGVFAVRGGPDGTVVLEEALEIGTAAAPLNLITEEAEMLRGVTSSGLLPMEGSERKARSAGRAARRICPRRLTRGLRHRRWRSAS